MEPETAFTSLAPPIFNGENYHIWAARMEAHLEANDLWEAVEEDYEINPLPENPTMAQLKVHKERKQRKAKARATLFAAVSATIFTRLMHFKTAVEVWRYLKQEYGGDERVRRMRALNLIREFDIQHMKENEAVKEFVDRLIGVVNQIRLLGTDFPDDRIVQKIMISVPEKFEATISYLENSKDLADITLTELISALQAQEQRRSLRQNSKVEGALKATSINGASGKKWKKVAYNKFDNKTGEGNEQGFSPCPHCRKTNHPPEKCWWRADVKCHNCKQLGHIQKVCKNAHQGETAAEAEEEAEEEILLVATSMEEEAQEEVLLVATSMAQELPGSEDLSKCIVEKKDRKSETFEEPYLRNGRKEKLGEEKLEIIDYDDPWEMLYKGPDKEKNQQKSKVEKKERKENLETGSIEKSKKKKKKKKKKKRA